MQASKEKDAFMGHTVNGVQVLPTVFGHFEALVSAACIAAIGAATLSVRWYFEYITDSMCREEA